jgi:hypothetical protein
MMIQYIYYYCGTFTCESLQGRYYKVSKCYKEDNKISYSLAVAVVFYIDNCSWLLCAIRDLNLPHDLIFEHVKVLAS